MRVIFMTTLLVVSMLSASAHATKQHKYDTGIVSFIGNNQVTIQSGTYTLRPEVKVVLITTEGNGAHYERRGSLSDVRPGKRVYLKSVGKMVYEIVTER